MLSFKYPATIESNGEGGFVASFRDVPEAITEGWSNEELKENALDALITCIDFYVESNREFPSPSEPEEGDLVVELPVSVIAKVLLINEMAKANIRQADLARRLNIRTQEMSRITNVQHATKIDTIQRAMKALGKELVVSVQ